MEEEEEVQELEEEEEAAEPVSMTLPEFRRAVLANVEAAAVAKSKGNEQFSAQAWEAAVAQYEEALGVLGGALAVPTLRERPDMADLLRRVHAAHAACHLNLAAVATKRGAPQASEEHCREALKVEPKSVKAHYRLAQALLAQCRDEEAACAAERAAALDGGRCSEVASLARRARAEVTQRKRREAQRFGGLFASPRYAQAAAEAHAAGLASERADRQRVADAALARHCAGEEDARALAAWVERGAPCLPARDAAPDGVASGPPAPVPGDHRATLMRLVRRAATAGALEDGEARQTLRAHGLAGGLASAGDPEAEGLQGEEAQSAQERALLCRVRALVAKAQQRQALSDEELGVLDGFRASEIARLQHLSATAQLTQEEQALLERLTAQRAQAAQAAREAKEASQMAAEALRKMREGVHVGPREKFHMMQALAAEEARLSALEEGPGLRSEEAATLRELRAVAQQKAQRAKAREGQQEMLAMMRSLST